jgi:hypothetical protein
LIVAGERARMVAQRPHGLEYLRGAYWSRRTGVKAAELLRPASQNSRSSRNSSRSGALIQRGL